jgi:hypothetical protein
VAPTVQPASPAADPPVDCFYVYPTVSRQKTVNANLTIDPEERAVAMAQAAQFSQVCRVYAPMYPQLTLAAIKKPGKISCCRRSAAYNGVDSAFRDYMAHYNGGRGIVFIGHSQGAMMLTALLKAEVDPKPGGAKAARFGAADGRQRDRARRQVRRRRLRQHPGLRVAAQTGCVVAYSSFEKTPPADALFGRVDRAHRARKSSTVPLQVLCVNPAAPGGGTANAGDPTSRRPASRRSSRQAAAPWGQREDAVRDVPQPVLRPLRQFGGATWLQIDRTGGSGRTCGRHQRCRGAGWGLPRDRCEHRPRQPRRSGPFRVGGLPSGGTSRWRAAPPEPTIAPALAEARDHGRQPAVQVRGVVAGPDGGRRR